MRARADIPGFGPWSVKQGLLHVEPPFALIEAMRTMRIHLDPVPRDNAPLLIAPGSHRLGRIPRASSRQWSNAAAPRTASPMRAMSGFYATPIVCVSPQAAARRVLQVDFSAQAPPPGLEIGLGLWRVLCKLGARIAASSR